LRSFGLIYATMSAIPVVPVRRTDFTCLDVLVDESGTIWMLQPTNIVRLIATTSEDGVWSVKIDQMYELPIQIVGRFGEDARGTVEMFEHGNGFFWIVALDSSDEEGMHRIYKVQLDDKEKLQVVDYLSTETITGIGKIEPWGLVLFHEEASVTTCSFEKFPMDSLHKINWTTVRDAVFNYMINVKGVNRDVTTPQALEVRLHANSLQFVAHKMIWFKVANNILVGFSAETMKIATIYELDVLDVVIEEASEGPNCSLHLLLNYDRCTTVALNKSTFGMKPVISHLRSAQFHKAYEIKSDLAAFMLVKRYCKDAFVGDDVPYTDPIYAIWVVDKLELKFLMNPVERYVIRNREPIPEAPSFIHNRIDPKIIRKGRMIEADAKGSDEEGSDKEVKSKKSKIKVPKGLSFDKEAKAGKDIKGYFEEKHPKPALKKKAEEAEPQPSKKKTKTAPAIRRIDDSDDEDVPAKKRLHAVADDDEEEIEEPRKKTKLKKNSRADSEDDEAFEVNYKEKSPTPSPEPSDADDLDGEEEEDEEDE
jgi:hypothetical protein